MDDAYLGGDFPGGRAGRGSENKIPIVAAVSPNQAGHPIHAKTSPVLAFRATPIASWASRNLAPCSGVLSDCLACFRAVTQAACAHEAVVTGGKDPNDLPQFRLINTVLGNLKTSLHGTFYPFKFDKYSRRYLGGYCFRFNRRFSIAVMIELIANAVCSCMPSTKQDLRVAEFYG